MTTTTTTTTTITSLPTPDSQLAHLEIFKQNPKFLLRLKLNLQQDSFYEAHQLFKTIHFRAMSSNSTGLVDDCIELIYYGILYFETKNQVTTYSLA